MSKCSHEGCQEEATHVPEICVPAKLHPAVREKSLKSLVSLPLCLTHCRKFDLVRFLKDTPNFKELVEIMVKGKCPPDFKRTFVHPVKLTDPAYLDMKKVHDEDAAKRGEPNQ